MYYSKHPKRKGKVNSQYIPPPSSKKSLTNNNLINVDLFIQDVLGIKLYPWQQTLLEYIYKNNVRKEKLVFPRGSQKDPITIKLLKIIYEMECDKNDS